jgi:hypothetical protein
VVAFAALMSGPPSVVVVIVDDDSSLVASRADADGYSGGLSRAWPMAPVGRCVASPNMSEQPAEIVDLALLPRSQAWGRRAMLPPTCFKITRAPWADARDLPNYDKWREYITTISAERASNMDDRDLRVYMTRGLVTELIYAAGGMEREVMLLKEILSVAQQFCDAHDLTLTDGSSVTPHVGLAAAHHASYTLVNAFSWARTVQERVERWLLPSLKDSGLKKDIKKGYPKFKRRLRSSVLAANYVFHAGALHGPSTPRFHIRPDGTAYLQFPDIMNNPITTWNEHTYDRERDAVQVLEDQFDAVISYVDHILDAFDNYSE